MSDSDVIVLSSDVEDSEKSPEPVSENPTADIVEKGPGSEKLISTSTSDSHNNPVSEIINLSSDSEFSSPVSIRPKQNIVSDMTSAKPVNDSSEGSSSVRTIEKNPSVDMVDINLPNDKINEDRTTVDMVDIDLSNDKIDVDPTTDEIVENPVDDNDEKPDANVFDENLSDISDNSMSSDSMSEVKCVDMPCDEIPCLDIQDDAESPKDCIMLMGFDLKPYSVPDSERYGNCRLISEFEKIAYMGEGSFGVVYKALDMKYETIVALKKMKISLKSEDPLSLHVMREINILKALDHPNIVNSRGVAVGGNFDSTYIILDCCDYDLARVIDDEKASSLLEEPQIKCIMLQLFEGLRYVHKLCILHRDLSCSNILFTDEGVLKIGDFGLARMAVYDEEMSPNMGSRWYRSIELLFGSKEYSFPTDLWSAGCIFAEVILKKPLFKAKSDMDVISLIIDLLGSPTESTWPGCSMLPVLEIYELREQLENNLAHLFSEQSEHCIDLLSKLFTFDPKQRISASAAYSHSYFSADPQTCSPKDLVKILEVTNELPEPDLQRVEGEKEDTDVVIEE